MSFAHGKSSVFKIEDSSTTLRDISQYLTNITLPRDNDVVEVTNFGSSAKQYVAGLPGGTISIEGIWDAAVDGYLEGILGSEKGFEYYPNSTASGNIKYSGNCIETSYEPPSAIDAAVTFTAEFQITGVVTRTTL